MSFFNKKNVKKFMNDAGIDLNPTVMAQQLASSKIGGDKLQTFIGISAPFITAIGSQLQESGAFRFGRFSDPRAQLRAQRENKALVPDDFGDSANKPVPAGRRGEIPDASKAYSNVKQTCLAAKSLWEDPDFPADSSSLFFDPREARSGIKWLRPSQISDSPEFIVDGASRFDVKQGELGDCWLLAAIGCISMHQDLMDQVVPTDQSFAKEYFGAFRFRFWHFGEWREVVVDDRLPTINGRLIYLHSATSSEFWSALMEKAYAKLCGSYQALKGGTTSEALEDFTGGIPEMFELREKTPKNLLDIMLKANSKRSLMACSIDASNSMALEAKLPNGLVVGHAYSITSISLKVEVAGKKLPLIRIRNPWGNEVEWRGAWSDNSREWQSLNESQRRDMGLTFENDGEFWMSYQDFSREFQKLEICHLGAQSLSGDQNEAAGHDDHNGHGHGPCVWEQNISHGEWRARVNAGGCRNFLDTFWTNPQFRVTVVDADDDDDDNRGTLIVGLMQKDRRALRKLGKDILTIGYTIYECPESAKGTLDMEFFKYNKSIARSPAFINLREVTGRHRLACGNYVIIPSTFNQNEEADFMLRVFSEKPHKQEEMDEKTSLVTPKSDLVPSTINDDQVKKLHDAFVKVAGDDKEIDAEELLDIINAAFAKDGLKPDYDAIERVANNRSKLVEGTPNSGSSGRSLLGLCCGFILENASNNANSKKKVELNGGPNATNPMPNGHQENIQEEDYVKTARQDQDDPEQSELAIPTKRSPPSPDVLGLGEIVDFQFNGFSLETSRSLVAMMDVDRSGKLSFDEFRALWELLRVWKTAFKQYDVDKNGTMNSFELRNALKAVGFTINNATFAALAMRFSRKDGSIAFDDYVMCCARIRTVFEMFSALKDTNDRVNIDETLFVNSVLYI